jgi:hypothetical protein
MAEKLIQLGDLFRYGNHSLFPSTPGRTLESIQFYGLLPVLREFTTLETQMFHRAGWEKTCGCVFSAVGCVMIVFHSARLMIGMNVMKGSEVHMQVGKEVLCAALGAQLPFRGNSWK